jgi:hypothetical protein
MEADYRIDGASAKKSRSIPSKKFPIAEKKLILSKDNLLEIIRTGDGASKAQIHLLNGTLTPCS